MSGDHEIPTPFRPDSSCKPDGPIVETRALRIGDQLVEKGVISRDQLLVALTEQRRSQKMLGECLMDLGFITEHTLAATLAETSGLNRFDLRHTVLDTETVHQLPREIAERYKVLPVAITETEAQVAMVDVYNVLAIDQVRLHLARHLDIIPLVTSETELMEAIDSYYGYEMSVDGLLREIEAGDASVASVLTGDEGFVNPTVRLVNAFILDAVKVGASDLHFEPEGLFVRLRYRIDGVMIQIRTFHKEYWPSICVRLKIMAKMNIAENRRPQDGRFTFHVAAREVDFRVASHPTVHGENFVIRVLDKARSLLPLSELGYSEGDVKTIKKMLLRPEGIIIVTGPTGSGKTTTLYSMLNYMNSISTNIMTLEEPVEYQLPLIRQSDVREAGGTGFAEGVRSILRQDPDIIFVGEVRDEETANMALRAAMTGHQVLTTLHTNDAVGAIHRLLDLKLPPSMLAGNLIGVLAQRLVRRLCPACKVAEPADPRDCKILGVVADQPPMLYRPRGCARCRMTGYKGRTAVSEILPFDEAMDELVAADATRGQMFTEMRRRNIRSAALHGIDKVLAGETSIEELIRTVNVTDRL